MVKPTPLPAPETNPGHLALDFLTGRAKKVAAAAMFTVAAHKTITETWNTRKTRRSFTVTIEDTDDIWSDVHKWVLATVPKGNQRTLLAQTARNGGGDEAEPVNGRRSPPPKLRLLYDGNRSQKLTIDGHRCSVVIDSDSSIDGFRMLRSRRMIFTCETIGGRDDLIDKLDRIAVDRSEQRPRVYMSSRWGEWRSQGDIPARPPSTLVLDDGVWERIESDLTRFLDQEEGYANLGLPWRRGMILWGPTGTGKTTVCKTVADYFGLDMYVAMLTDLESDSNLVSLFNAVPPRSVLVLEDIDVLHAARERDDKATGITMSGLLNALDGIVSPPGSSQL